MSEDHTTTAISFQLQLVQGISALRKEGHADAATEGDRVCSPFIDVAGQQLEVRVPFITNDFTARKETNWDDHRCGRVFKFVSHGVTPYYSLIFSLASILTRWNSFQPHLYTAYYARIAVGYLVLVIACARMS
jgi:hypothetical protein